VGEEKKRVTKRERKIEGSRFAQPHIYRSKASAGLILFAERRS